MTIEQRVEELERKVAKLTKETPKASDASGAILKRGRFDFLWSDTNDAYEIVEWDYDNQHCWVVAFFDKTSERYDMRTVGPRFTDADHDAFELAQMAFNWLAENERDDDDDNT